MVPNGTRDAYTGCWQCQSFREGDDHQCAATDGVPGEGAAHGPFTSANGTAVLTEFLDFMDGNNELQEISLHYHAVPHRIL
jgi:hypothetical protein